MGRETIKDLDDSGPASRPAGPGLVLLSCCERPLFAAHPLKGSLELGRDFSPETAADQRVSRKHARLTVAGNGVRVNDLGSSNGTFVDGQPCRTDHLVEQQAILRLGRTFFWLVPDIGPFLNGTVTNGTGGVIGPQLARVFARVELAARTSDSVLVLGESGSGKELAARRFHASSSRAEGPFVAVNCAAIPEGIAERLLFGARKGAFSGAVETTEGYLQAADRGTLFLDELAELDPLVQPKLLRVLETKEVTRIGDTKGRVLELGVCAATLRDIPGRVATGKFREDLYYRLGRPVLHLPPLRRRREEIPFLVAAALASVAPQLVADHLLLEACLVRRWPGNVRELLSEVTRAGQTARMAGRTVVERGDLGPSAGLPLDQVAAAERMAPTPSPLQPSPFSGAPAEAFPSAERISLALSAVEGNVTRAAAALGLHRNQLRRWLAKNPLPTSGDGDGA